MIATTCKHARKVSKGKDRKGQQRWKCKNCGVCFTDFAPKPLGDMQVNVEKAKLALRMLTEGMSIRATERITGIHRDTLCKLVVLFGTACKKFMDDRMHGLKLTHLQFDEQWTFVGKKQSRLTVEEKETCHDLGDAYIWTCIDEQTKLLPSFLIGKRSADNARRFLSDVAKRLARPKPHASDAPRIRKGQLSTDRSNLDRWLGWLSRGCRSGVRTTRQIRSDNQRVPQCDDDLHTFRNGRHKANWYTRYRPQVGTNDRNFAR
jgi:transposase-like protein